MPEEKRTAGEKRKEDDKKLDEEIEKAEKAFLEREKREKEGKEKKEKELTEVKKGSEKEGKKKEEKPAKEPGIELGEFNPWSVLLYPHLAEKSMNMVEMENKLIFMVNRKATKDDIIQAVERGFDVRVRSVNTEITTKGQKKAYIKLFPDYDATDIASRLGMI